MSLIELFDSESGGSTREVLAENNSRLIFKQLDAQHTRAVPTGWLISDTQLGIRPMKPFYIVSIVSALLAIALGSVGNDCIAEDGSNASPMVSKKNAKGFPPVPTVESMIRRSESVEKMLARTPIESQYEHSAILQISRSRITDSGTSDETIPWSDSIAGWTPAEFYSLPLYFEQTNLERFSSTAPEWTRPVLSYAKFVGTIPILPYKIGTHSPRDHMYTIGHYRYGQSAPQRSERETLSRRGLLFQGLATTGFVFLIP